MSVTDQTVTVVLATGRGEALAPLTRDRAKAAVPFGGEYRLIDFALSNCLHSGLRRVLVLTQDNAHSLNRHLRDAWSVYNAELGEYVTSLPPQGRDGPAQYRGSADALHQSLYLLERSGAAHVLVLAGDHVYRMDYAALLDAHAASGAEATLVCVERRGGERPRVRVDGERVLAMERADGIAREGESLSAMGIAVLRLERLVALLRAGAGADTGDFDLERDVLPGVVAAGEVAAYRFGGRKGRVSQDRFWSEVGDLDAYYDAQMALLEPVAPLDLYQEDWAIWSHAGRNPPARMVSSPSGNEGIFVNSIVSNGAVNVGAAVGHSVICPRVRVGDAATVEQAILFNGVHVGAGAELRRCIVDKRVRIPPGDRIGFDRDADRARFPVSAGGVVVVPKGYGD